MKKFLALYQSPISAMERMKGATPEQAKAGMDAWMNWKKNNEDMIVDFGMPLGDGKVVAGSSVSDGNNTVSGYSILQGDSMESVTKKLKDHPHFMLPGSTIEVREFLSMPGM